jgi:hypothetical protein
MCSIHAKSGDPKKKCLTLTKTDEVCGSKAYYNIAYQSCRPYKKPVNFGNDKRDYSGAFCPPSEDPPGTGNLDGVYDEETQCIKRND